MAIKDILVHLDASSRSGIRLALASGLAARHGAHLTALYVIDLLPPTAAIGDPSGYVDAQAIDDLMNLMRDGAMSEARRVEQDFRSLVERDGVGGEWRLAEGSTAETVALHGRYADLTVVGQRNPDEPQPGTGDQVPATALLSSGRPVLAVPYAGDFATLGQTVLVGWKARPQAARAINDAIPMLQAAQSVTVLAINPEDGIGGEGDVPAADIAHHLARHGVKAEAAYTVARDIAEGEALLDYAADLGADLIVAGGYGHSRMREFVFGGVTRSLLAEMTVPVLMSH